MKRLRIAAGMVQRERYIANVIVIHAMVAMCSEGMAEIPAPAARLRPWYADHKYSANA